MEPPCNFDYLSNLPDSTFHQILSLLDVKDIARISMLSRRCRKLCLSLPSLTIDLGEIRGDRNFYLFSLFLERYMSLRNSGVGMHEFALIVCCKNLKTYKKDVGFRVGSWLLQATRYNVEKISLELGAVEDLTLPSDVLSCASLRELNLKLNMCYDAHEDGYLKLQTTPFCWLQILTLSGLFAPKKLDEWISSCKCLKKLHLDAVYGIDKLHISSSTLEYLQIENIGTNYIEIEVSTERLEYLSITWGEASVFQSLRLHAAKLKQFYWDGKVCDYSYEGNFESLEYADIDIGFHSLRDLMSPMSNDEYEAVVNGVVVSILQTVCRVSSFRVTDLFLEEISFQTLELPEFCNLHSLTLLSHHWDSTIPSIASFLNLTPHLDTFKICFGPQYTRGVTIANYEAAYWESQNLNFVYSMKEVKMEINGEQNEIELIKYLLKNAKALEKITIRYSSRVLPRLSEISTKLQQFKKASSSISVYFLPK